MNPSTPHRNPLRGSCRRLPLTALPALIALASAPLASTAQSQTAGMFGAAFLPTAENIGTLRFGPSNPSTDEAIRQELRILARVIERKVRRSDTERNGSYRMGIPMLLSSSPATPEAAYIEGFGALISLEADFPLARPATTNAAPAATDAKDSDWEAARRELQGEAGLQDQTTTYNADQVLKLRETLVTALRQATNLVHLASNDVVALVVRGPAAAGSHPSSESGASPDPTTGAVDENGNPLGGFGQAGVTASGGFGGGFEFSTSVTSSSDPTTPPHTSTRRRFFHLGGTPDGAVAVGGEPISYLTLRVRKADLDAFAAAKISPSEFDGRITHHAYNERGSGASLNTRRVF